MNHRLGALKSCTECRRRKIRCDRQLPCRACQERDEASFCHREPLPLKRSKAADKSLPDPLSPNASLEAEVASLRSRVLRLEERLDLSDEAPRANDDVAQEGALQSGIAGAMEDAAFGVGQARSWPQDTSTVNARPVQVHHAKWLNPTPFEDCVASLPPRQQCDRIIEAFMLHLNWFCGSIYEPHFRVMQRDFWANELRGGVQDDIFVSLLFAVLSVSGFLLRPTDLQAVGVQPNAVSSMAMTWFDYSYATFFRCNGMVEPTTISIQAMIVLNYAFHLSGNTKIHQPMFGVNVATARAASLHLLGSQERSPPGLTLNGETERRVWWSLVEIDWFFTPYRRYSYIAPHDFDTEMPHLLDEDMLIHSHRTELHQMTYFLAGCHSSSILYDLYATLRPNQHPSREAVELAGSRMDQLRAEVAGLQPSRISPPNYMEIQRITSMSLAYRAYLVRRPYFVRSLSDATLSSTRTACVDAAKFILSATDEGIRAEFHRLWNVTMWLVAAGLILALNLIKTTSERTDQAAIANDREHLASLAHILATKADRSGIGQRGARLISNLLAMENDILLGRHVSLARFSRQDFLNLVSRDNTTIDKVTPRPESNSIGLDMTMATAPFATELDQLDLDQPQSWLAQDAEQLMMNLTGTSTIEQDQFFDFFADLSNR